jgi:DNA-binding transcriptional LysR family regulator
MEIRQLEIFQALAAELNFTRAAARAHCVQSNVTTQIRALETELGVPLFERLGRTVVLAEAGQRLLPYANQVLQLLREAHSVAAKGEQPAGKLCVASPETVVTYHLPPILRLFQQKFPLVELAFLPLATAIMPQQIARGDIDFAFLIGDLTDERGLEVEDLSPEPMALAVSPKHPQAGRAHVRARDIKDDAFLLTQQRCSYRVKFEKALASAGVVLSSVLEFDSVEAIKQCATLGMGIAVLPRITLGAELAKGSLVELPWAGQDLTMSTQVAWHKRKWISPAMAACLAVVRQEMRKRSVPGHKTRQVQSA